MLALGFAVNILILTPLTLALLTDRAAMKPVYGPDTDARRILTCVYGAIGIVSLYALVCLGLGQTQTATQLAWTLFPLQIAYKLATACVVGLRSPVVITNLMVVVLLIAVLATL